MMTSVGFAGCAAPLEDGADPDLESSGLATGAQGEAVETLHAYLHEHGYFPNDELSERFPDWVPVVAEGPEADDVFDDRTEEAVVVFQTSHGLPGTGVVDDETLALMTAPQCGNPVHEHGAEDDKWHHDAQWSSPYPLGGTYTYRVIGAPPGWSTAQAAQAVRTAFDVWEPHIGVSFVQTSGSSHATVRFVAIDGPGGTLGLAYNNYWGGQRHSIDIDTGEGWSFSGTPNMGRTLVHEIGHMLGFNHSSIGGAIMFPTTNPFATGPATLADDDLAALTFRYRQWVGQSGAARDIGVGANGAWVIGNTGWSGGYSIHRFNGVGWVHIPGGGVRIAVGDQAWIVNSAGTIYRRMGSTLWEPAGTHWQNVSAGSTAIDIGVASGRLPWAISTQANGAGNVILRYNGSTWQPVGGAATRISVGDDGSVYVVNSNGAVYRRLGITTSNPSGTSWQRVGDLAPNVFGNETGVAKDVSVSRSGVAWVTGTADGSPMTFVRQEQSAISGSADAFNRWVPVPGNGTSIASWFVHDPWVVAANGAISRRLPGN